MPLIEHNWLLGSMPGQGKTSAVRVLVSAAALDPSVEMWLHELKGTGDLDPFEQVATGSSPASTTSRSGTRPSR